MCRHDERFGDAAEIERQRGGGREFGVRVLFSGADLSKPERCAELSPAPRSASAPWTSWSTMRASNTCRPSRTSRWSTGMRSSPSICPRPSTPSAALPGMKSRGWGRLINIASVHGLVASPNKVAYCAAKHGLVGLTKVVALETAKTGITCNAICPGWVLTPLCRQANRGEGQDRGCVDCRGRDESPDREAALDALYRDRRAGALVVFLCCEGASNLTGASIPVDGGWTAQ